MVMIIFILSIAIFLILSRRKLGIFGLAVFMGLILSQTWGSELAKYAGQLGLNIPQSTLAGIVNLILILVPAFLLLVKGGKQDNLLLGVASSAILAIFIGAISSSSLELIFIFDRLSRMVADFLVNYHSLIVAAVASWIMLEAVSLKFKKQEQKS